MSADDTSLTGAGFVTYTITLQNTGSDAVTMNQILSTLASTPSNISYVGGSSTYNGVTVSDPTVSGQTLLWNGTFTVAGGSTGTLTFQASVPGTNGVYTTTAWAITGNAAIDTTLAITSGASSTPDAPASVSVTVTPPVPPVAVDDNFPATEDTILTGNVLANDTDANGDPIAVTGFSVDTDGNGSQEQFSAGQMAIIQGVGSLSISLNGSFTFLPEADDSGVVPTVTYQISDGQGGTDAAALFIGPVAAVNDPPLTTDDVVVTAEDTPVLLLPADFGNYSDPENSPLASVRITTLPTKGTLQLFDGSVWSSVTANQVISAADLAAGRLRYSPPGDESGNPLTIVQFQVSDGTDFSSVQSLSVQVTPVNDPPMAVADSFATSMDVSVSVAVKSNDSDAEGDSLSVTHVNGQLISPGGLPVLVDHGTVALNVAGTLLTFTPESGYTGSVSFDDTLPGSTLVGRIYDQHGNLIGEQQVLSDSSGNWMMNFPGSLIMEHPHRMEILQTAAIHSSAGESGFGFRRYFQPAACASIFFTTELTPTEVLKRSAYEMVDSLHRGNLSPYGFSWCAQAHELVAASSSAGQG